MNLHCIEKLLILVFTITGYVSIFAFLLLVGITIGIVPSTVGLKISAITPRIKRH